MYDGFLNGGLMDCDFREYAVGFALVAAGVVSWKLLFGSSALHY